MSSSGGAGEHFSLVWNTFPRNLSSGLYNLLTCEQLVDVTLAAEGQILRAHKLILSVCSSYFRELFKVRRNQCASCLSVRGVFFFSLSLLLAGEESKQASKQARMRCYDRGVMERASQQASCAAFIRSTCAKF